MTPLQRGRVYNTLKRPMRFSGSDALPRHEHAERFVSEGVAFKIDYTRQRLYLNGSRSFYAFSDVTKTFVDYLDWLALHATISTEMAVE